MKTCTKCNTNKELHEFGRDRRHKDGLQSHCKLCQNLSNKIWADKNREKKRAIDRQYTKANVDANRHRARKWSQSNPELNRARASNWKKSNPHRVNAQVAKRKADELLATPRWLTEEHFAQIEQFYELAHKMSRESGTKFVVDHIIPLCGENVKGLHVPWNLQVITSRDNCIKGNRVNS